MVDLWPRTIVGGANHKITDPLKFTIAKPIWFGGLALERVKDSWSTVQMRQTYNDLSCNIVGVSVGASYMGFQKSEYPTTLDGSGLESDTNAFKYITGWIEGSCFMPPDSDFGTAYYQGELLKVVSDSHTFEGVTKNLPSVQPTSKDFGGDGMLPTTGLLADGGNFTGSLLREVMGVLDDIVGHSRQTVSATPGDISATNLVNVQLSLRAPIWWVPSE